MKKNQSPFSTLFPGGHVHRGSDVDVRLTAALDPNHSRVFGKEELDLP